MSPPRILLVEDHWLVAMHAQYLLEDLGCVVIGPLATLAEAEAAAESEIIDAAVLDAFLGDERCFPVAEALIQRGIPICMATGCAPSMLPETLQACPRLEKPYTREAVIEVLRTLGLIFKAAKIRRPEPDCERSWASPG